MNLFESSRDAANQEAFSTLMPGTKEKAGFFSGLPTATVQTVGSILNDAAMPLADMATPAIMPAAKKVDELFKTDVQGFLQRQQQATHDAMVNWTPDPSTVGWLGNVVYGAGNVLGDVALGTMATGNPYAGVTYASGVQGYKSYRMGQYQGLDDTTASKMAAITAGSTFLGAFLPVTATKGMAFGLTGLGMQAEVAGANLAAKGIYAAAGATATIASNTGLKLAAGGAIQAATGIPTRGLTSQVLRNAGYDDMAKQYEAFDVGEMASDFAIGALFAGGVHAYDRYFGTKIPDPKPSDLAAALALNNASHLETGTAPGIPTDPAARAAHVENINRAIEDILADREVDVSDNVTRANFIENPVAVETRKGVLNAVEDHLGADWQSLKIELESRGLPGDTELYSRGQGQGSTVDLITKAAGESFGTHSQALIDSGTIKTVQSVSELPPRADGQPHPADTKAVFDGNTVHIVADNVSPSEVKGVVLHEVGAHYGMEQMLGNDGYMRLLSDIDAKVRAGVADFTAAADQVPADTPANQRMAETLAYLVQNRPELPLIQRLISQLKTAVYRLTGGRFVDLNADDIRTLAVAALKRVSSTEAARMQMPGLTAPLYARAGVEAPGAGVAQENLNGFEPDLRVIVPIGRMKLPEKPLILTGTNQKNAARQIAAIDDILTKFPDADTSPLEWSKMMAYAMATNDVPVPPYRFLNDINSDGAHNNLSRLSPGQIADADHGFENAKLFREAYLNKELQVTTTGKLFMWSFLSRGVSPYTQEGLFIDGFKGADAWIAKAAEGNFTEKDFADYEAWAKSVAPQGSGQPGSGATHNLNAFGRLFLFKMGQKNENGVSLLQTMHDMMSDPEMTGQRLRRWFIQNTEGVGIDNKVVSFTLLVAGFPDVMVLDRVQIRQLWDDGRFGDRNLYDGRKVDGKPVAGSALSEITYGARGLFIYEAIERALAKRVENIYASLGRPQDASIGRYHWETWVADSQQEASHGTLDAILHDAKGDAAMIEKVTAKEGEYGAYAYGARYGRDANGPYFLYNTPGGQEYRFSVPAFREFLYAVKSPANKVVPTKFKVTEAGNAPWYERPEVNKQALDELARQYAGDAGAGQGAGAVSENGQGQAVPVQPGRGADAYSAEALMRDNPALTYVGADGTMVPAARALIGADAEIALAKQESQGYDAAVACALRG